MTRHPRRSWALTGLAFLSLTLPTATSLAQAPAAPATPAGSASPDTPPASAATPPAATDASAEADAATQANKRGLAKAHFEKGVALFQDGAWGPALAEFLESRSLYATISATTNAAICLHKLERFGEALDMYEALLREFPEVRPDDKTAAQRAIVELRAQVGTIAISGAEIGSSITIDGRVFGDYPPTSPIYVSSGSHAVRLYKEGFEPFEVRLDIAGGQTSNVTAQMQAIRIAGRLKVIETMGKSLDIVVDNVVVGKTPWEGPVAEGRHTVLLRGENGYGTPPASAPVKLQELTTLTLRAEELGAALRIDPTPIGASVSIDSVPVGRGSWEGRLRVGEHRIDVSADGFFSQTKQIKLRPHADEQLSVRLAADPDAVVNYERSPITVGIVGGVPFAPALNGAVADSCTGSCESSLGFGAQAMLHIGYERPSGLGVGLAAGYLFLKEDFTGRPAVLRPKGDTTDSGTVDDAIRMNALLVGLTGSMHIGDRYPVLLRLGVGVARAALDDERRGTFGSPRYDTGYVMSSTPGTFLYINPEVQFGIKLNDHIEISAALQAMMLLGLEGPVWDTTVQVPAGTKGIGTYKDESLLGRFVFLPTPSLAARYAF